MRLNDPFDTIGKIISYLLMEKKIVVEELFLFLDEIYFHVWKNYLQIRDLLYDRES